MADDFDDDIEEYLDPELDPQPGGSGPVTASRIVVALHVVGSSALATLAGAAFVDGDTTRALVFAGLSVVVFVAGLAAGQLVAAR